MWPDVPPYAVSPAPTYTQSTPHTEGANSSLSLSRHLVTHASTHSTAYSTLYGCSSALPRPLPTACSYIWLSFSNLLSPTMFILSKSLLAVSILHVCKSFLNPLLSTKVCYSLYFLTPFSHAQKAHLYSTPFYPRFSPCKIFIISFLHLCPQLQQREINFYPFLAKTSHCSGISLIHSSILLCLEPQSAQSTADGSPVCCDLYFYPPLSNKCRDVGRSRDSWSSLP